MKCKKLKDEKVEGKIDALEDLTAVIKGDLINIATEAVDSCNMCHDHD